MSKRLPNPRLVKINRDYLVSEITAVLGIHKNTVRNWIRNGLPTVDNRKPLMVRGIVLREYLTAKRRARKQASPPGHLFCLRCKVPQKPHPGLTDVIVTTNGSVSIRGFCPVCETLMHRRASAAQLSEHWPHLVDSQTHAKRRLV